MAQKTKTLSGASQDAYFRRALKSHASLSAEDRDRLVDRLRREIAQLRVRAQPRQDASPPPPSLHASAAPPTTSFFDPFSPNVIVVVRTSGRDAALAALKGIDRADHLHLLAREQRLAVPAHLSSAEELRAAIIDAAERRIANRMAAAS